MNGDSLGEERMDAVGKVAQVAELRPLSKNEIDRRIQGLLADLVPRRGDGASLAPRPITPAELVRRLAPFVGLN